MNNLISVQQFVEPKDLESIFTHAELLANPYRNMDLYYILRSKMVGLFFFEKSTRTKISFDVAVKKLGGQTFDFCQEVSSLGKGESIEDTIKIAEQYSDCLVVRHRDHNLIDTISKTSDIPIINAGSSEHPTQSIIDLFTIKQETGKIHGTNILLFGDLKYNRTIVSLLGLLKLYKHIRVHLYSPVEFRLPKELFYENIIFVEESDLKKVLPTIDVVYVVRPQTEIHVDSGELYNICYRNQFIFSEKELDILNKNAVIMHPLPRNEELSKSADNDKRAVYFKQARNGLYVRMAILQEILKKHDI